MAERAADFRAWAESRIRHCRDIEARFSTKSLSMFEAIAERRALQAALRILFPESAEAMAGRKGSEPPSDLGRKPTKRQGGK